MFEQDYFMRIVHEMVRMLIKIVFKVDMDEEDEFKNWSADDIIAYDKLKRLIEAGDINEAENQLIDSLDEYDLVKFQMALRFYDFLNTKDNDFLEKHDFSRNEVKEGIKSAARFYGYESFLSCFTENMD